MKIHCLILALFEKEVFSAKAKIWEKKKSTFYNFWISESLKPTWNTADPVYSMWQVKLPVFFTSQEIVSELEINP